MNHGCTVPVNVHAADATTCRANGACVTQFYLDNLPETPGFNEQGGHHVNLGDCERVFRQHESGALISNAQTAADAATDPTPVPPHSAVYFQAVAGTTAGVQPNGTLVVSFSDPGSPTVSMNPTGFATEQAPAPGFSGMGIYFALSPGAGAKVTVSLTCSAGNANPYVGVSAVYLDTGLMSGTSFPPPGSSAPACGVGFYPGPIAPGTATAANVYNPAPFLVGITSDTLVTTNDAGGFFVFSIFGAPSSSAQFQATLEIGTS